MKRKFILLTITLTALAPAISLVGCGDPDTPEPEYHSYELKRDGSMHFTDIFTLLKGNYYRFWLNLIDSRITGGFGFAKNEMGSILVDVDNVKVLKNGNELPFTEEKTEYSWEIIFSTGEPPTDLEIFLRCNKTIENVYGYF